MPRKAMFTKEELVSAALEITRESGIGSVTARELGSRLGCSPRPLFTYFSTVDELKQAVRERALGLYRLSVRDAIADADILRGVFMGHVNFAGSEPELFSLIFESPVRDGETSLSGLIGETFELAHRRVVSEYSLDEASAGEFFRCLWLLAHGAASISAASGIALSDEEAEALFSRGKRGLLLSFLPDAALSSDSSGNRNRSSRDRRFEEWID